jgi:hypothetical protein
MGSRYRREQPQAFQWTRALRWSETSITNALHYQVRWKTKATHQVEIAQRAVFFPGGQEWSSKCHFYQGETTLTNTFFFVLESRQRCATNGLRPHLSGRRVLRLSQLLDICQSSLFHTQIFTHFIPARETLVAVKRQAPTKQVTPANI